MSSNNSTQRTALRNKLLSNGYHPLPLADKGVFIKGWSRAEIDADWLKPHARNGRYSNTGLRCDNLLAFDIDVLDDDLAQACEDYVEREAGPSELCRVGQWPKRLILYRLAELDAALVRSGRTGDYGGHMVELLATHGRQFAAFGIHPGTGEPYQWEGDSPETVAWSDLPEIEAERALEIMEGLDDLLAATGLEKRRRRHVRAGSGENEYDLLPDSLVEYEGVRVEWRDLVPDLTKEGGFGNLWREEYDDWGDSSAVHFYLARGSGEPCAHDFINDCTHWESLWRPEFGELLPPPPDKRDNSFFPPEVSDMIENVVIMSNKTVRRLSDPMRSYPLEGWRASHQHLRVPDPNPPASNPNKTIPFTKLWEADDSTMRADYASMRPDKPDDDIFRDRGTRVMNTYQPPDHDQRGGECDTFMEFIGHLVPGELERRLFLDWLAHKVQFPVDRMHGMVMVTPTFGTGRGTLVQTMQKLFGPRYVNEIELRDLIGRGGQSHFNAYLCDSLIVTVGEALEEREDTSKWQARHLAYERLKIVCDPIPGRAMIRRKYGGNTVEWIFASLFISSNHPDALAIEPGDRRLIVIDNGTTPLTQAPNDLNDRIHAWNKKPANIAALFERLCAWEPMQEYDPLREPPMTPAKERMIEASQSDTDRLFEIYCEEAKGDLITSAQWRHFAHAARIKYDLDLPADPARRDIALNAVLQKNCHRIAGLPKAGLKVKGRPVRPWIIRNVNKWKGSRDYAAIRAEILRNGEPGGMVVELPPKGDD